MRRLAFLSVASTDRFTCTLRRRRTKLNQRGRTTATRDRTTALILTDVTAPETRKCVEPIQGDLTRISHAKLTFELTLEIITGAGSLYGAMRRAWYWRRIRWKSVTPQAKPIDAISKVEAQVILRTTC